MECTAVGLQALVNEPGIDTFADTRFNLGSFNMSFRICKSIEIENGHLLTKHPDKCRFPHGHSRRVDIVLAADSLDANDMVCDFKAIKAAIETFLDSWDHAFCLNTADPQFDHFQKTYGAQIIPFEKADPTSEMMAKTIYDVLKKRLAEAATNNDARYRIPAGVRVERVRITETSSSWAEYGE